MQMEFFPCNTKKDYSSPLNEKTEKPCPKITWPEDRLWCATLV